MNPTIEPSLLSKPHIRPLGDQVVLVQVNKPSVLRDAVGAGMSVDVRMSSGGVAIPDSVENDAQEFVVVALGDGYVEGCPVCEPDGRRHAFEVGVGDRVLVCPWLLTTVNLGETEYHLVSDRDVLGVFR